MRHHGGGGLIGLWFGLFLGLFLPGLSVTWASETEQAPAVLGPEAPRGETSATDNAAPSTPAEPQAVPADPEPEPPLLSEKPTPKEVKAVYEKARSLFEERRCVEVQRHLDAIQATKHAKTYKARTSLLSGICLSELSRLDEAADALNHALGAWTTLGDGIRYMLGEVRFRQGEYAKARYNYNKLIEDYPDSLMVEDALVRSIECDLHQKRLGTVLSRVSQTLKEKEEQAETERVRMGWKEPKEYEKQGDLLWLRAQALQGRKEHLAEARTLLDILVDGKAAQYRDRAQKRLDELRKDGVPYIPDFGPGLLGYVSRLRTIWALDEVVAEVDAALKHTKPDSPDYSVEIAQRLRYHRGRALYFLQRYEDARQDFEGLLAELPAQESDRRPTTMNQLAKTLVRLGRPDEAISVYQDLYQRFPDTRDGDEGLFMVAWTLAEGNRFKEALAALNNYAERFPSRGKFSDKVSWFRAWFAYRDGDLDTALERFMTLRGKGKRNETTRQATYWAARCLQRKQREAEAETLYRELAEEDQFRYYRLAAMQRLRVMDQVNHAVREMNIWAAQDPDGDGDTDAPVPEAAEPAYSDGDGESPIGEQAVWQRISGITPDASPYSLMDLRQGIADYQVFLKGRRDGVFRYALNRLSKEAKTHEETFPSLRRAVLWREVGDRERAGMDMTGFAEELLALWRERKNPLVRWEDETEEDFALRQKKREALSKFTDRFYMDMVELFTDCDRPHEAFRIFAAFFSYKKAPGVTLEWRRKLFYPAAYAALVEQNAERYDVPDDLVLSIMRTESHFHTLATSNVGAMGLMQVMPHTGARIAERIGDESEDRLKLYQPDVTIRYGTWYLSALLQKFQRQVPLAVASYNGGPHNVSVWLNAGKDLVWDEFIESIGFSQTRHYTKTVLQTMAVYRLLYTGTFDSWNLMAPIDARMEDNINW